MNLDALDSARVFAAARKEKVDQLDILLDVADEREDRNTVLVLKRRHANVVGQEVADRFESGDGTGGRRVNHEDDVVGTEPGRSKLRHAAEHLTAFQNAVKIRHADDL